MTQNVDHRVLDLLDDVEQRIVRGEQDVAMLKKIRAFIKGELAEPPSGALAESPSEPPQRGRRSQLVFCSIAWLPQAAAAGVILQEYGPLHTQKIVEHLLAMGYPADGDTDEERKKRLANSLYSVMAKTPKRFRKVAPGVWDVVREEKSLPSLNDLRKEFHRESVERLNRQSAHKESPHRHD